MDSDGSNPRYLRNGYWTWGRIAWSPDGSRIGALSPSPFSSSIVSFPDGGAGAPEARYDAPTNRFPDEPDWSADGRSMVFSEGGRYPDTHRRIFILTIETGEVRQLIPSLTSPLQRPYDDSAPVWARARR